MTIPFMQQAFGDQRHDTFDRANESPLAGRWSQTVEAADKKYILRDNHIVAVPQVGTNHGYQTVGLSSANHWVEGFVNIQSGVGTRYCGVMARFNGASTFYTVYLSSANTINLARVVNGSKTILDSNSAYGGTTRTLTLTCNGSTISAEPYGLTAVDTAIPSGNLVGVYTYNNGTNVTEMFIDDWKCNVI